MLKVQFYALMVVFGVLGVMPDPGGPGVPHGDHLLHFLGWAVGAVSARVAYPAIAPALIGFSLWGYSLAIEIAQIAVPSRSFELADLLANAGGLAIGLLISMMIRPRPS